MTATFQRLAIINRGEPAMRLIRAVCELNHERSDGAPLRTIAFFTEPDRRAMFVRAADSAVCLGEATWVDGRDGVTKSAYLDYARLEQALVSSRADAAWVGWGFVAEHAEFAELCRRLDIVFVGPNANVMRWLGDKVAAKHVAERVGVPVIPWSGNPVETPDEARACAEQLGYPVLVKASAGGGGRGIRRVESAAELPDALIGARAEALKSFGDGTVFVEKVITAARHVEVQVIADRHGTTWAVGVRDCTIQRRNQKLIEEAPSPALSAQQHAALCDAAVRLATSAGYENAGTVEFLFDPIAQQVYFMEVNTRLQVEHPVTEITTGLDLVKLQLHVAAGGRLDGSPPPIAGHAAEVRLNAEDPDAGFAPAPGVIELLRLPTGPGIRVDTGVAEGDAVPPQFDSMIAKIIAHGRTREEAFARLQRALSESVIVLRGGTTNKAFLLELLGRAEIRAASADTAWLDRMEHGARLRPHAALALVQTAIDVYDAELALEQRQFYASAARGRPRLRTEAGCTANLRYGGQAYAVRVLGMGPQAYRLEVDGQRLDVQVEQVGRFERQLTCGGRRYATLSVAQGPRHLIEVEGTPHTVARDDGGTVRAPAPALVLMIAVEPGQMVSAGTRLVVLEAMKMELPVLAPFSGRVREVLVAPHAQVDAGAPLVVLEVLGDERPRAAIERLSFGALTQAENSAQTHCRRWLNDLRRLTLGYDVDPGESRQWAIEYSNLSAAVAPDDAELFAGEDETLAAFVDLASLFRRQPASDDPHGFEPTFTEEFLHIYLRSLDARDASLPASFLDKLWRAVAHYGLRDLERVPELETALLRIFKAHQRRDQLGGLILGILERRLDLVARMTERATADFRALLDRLIAVTHGRHAALSETAREVRYRLFDQPLFEQARERVYREMDAHLDHLARFSDAPDRSERIDALVNCPQPLVSVLAERFAAADSALRALMLEVLLRRYYRIRSIESLHTCTIDGRAAASAEYEYEGRRIWAVATHAEHAALRDAAVAIRPLLSDAPSSHDVVVDFFLWSAAPLPAAEEHERALRALLNEVVFPRRLRRIVVVVAGPGSGRGIAGVRHFTYRPADGGYAEDRVYRGIHPMMAKRMHLWRLSNFNLERLQSAEDIYLFRGVAKQNANDARLFAIAEVRDLTAVRENGGRVVSLPYLERMLMEALSAIRRVQAQRPPQARYPWNRVLLYVWPPLDLRPDELNELIRRLAPATEGLGMDQVVVRARMPDLETGRLQDTVLRLSNPQGAGLFITSGPPPTQPVDALSEYDQKVVRMRQRGLPYPYETLRMLTPERDATRAEFPPGEFVEYDLDGRILVPVERPRGRNTANVVVGVIRNFTSKHPEGMTRVVLLGDPSKAMGAVAEPECRRIIAALDLAERLGVPLEWFSISAGAKIAMDSGTENMDWIASVLRRLIEFTQAGGEVNVIVNGINVGAQPYWNAEATMLLHTSGILVMTPPGAMVLTGKEALDYSGSVSAEDNQGIGGYERIMGPNGQAQYWARDVTEAAQILFRHYAHTYRAPGERFPRRGVTTDPVDRDVRAHPHGGEFALVGDIFSNATNPGRKRPFEIRRVMAAVVDQDQAPLERWAAMRDAEMAVVWDAHLGGYPVCLLGIESTPLPRLGFVPADGPDQWTAGTLFPRSSKKIARALNATSGNRPVVILANLSGFDGSPESMRELQLEFGAEIGRAVVNFRGPIVFCVVSRYHGGAYVVFSGKLNESIEAAALEGSYASVIGGAPAAAVVFAAEVDARTGSDPRIEAINREIAATDEPGQKARLRAQRDELYTSVRSERLGQVADEFDRIHSIQRALRVGSLDHILPAQRLRPYLIEAIERGMQRWQARASA